MGNQSIGNIMALSNIFSLLKVIYFVKKLFGFVNKLHIKHKVNLLS